jgi:hypothetical protein
MHQLHGLITLGQNELRGGAMANTLVGRCGCRGREQSAGARRPGAQNRRRSRLLRTLKTGGGMVRSRSTTALSHAQ